MLRVILASLLVFAAPAVARSQGEAAPAPAPRVPAREALVANNTDRVLRELFLHPVEATEDRGPDRLGTGVLPPRATLRVPLERRARGNGCAWQAVAVFEDGEEERRRFDACRNPRAVFAETGPVREVEVQNDTDTPLRELFLSPPGSRERGRDRLGAETVAAGESFRLRLRGAAAAPCLFDVRGVFADDSEEARERVDLCRARRVGFGDPSAPVREVPVVNRGRGAIRELYARPSAGRASSASGDVGGAGGWGADRLGSAVLAPRDDFRLRVRSRGCAFDLRAVGTNNREEVRDGVDLCAVQGVVFGERPEEPPRRVVLVNHHRRTVRQAFLAATKGGEWGEDALGSAVLAPGARYELTFDGGGCHADLRVVFDTEAAEERRGVDVCAETLVSLRPGWTVDERLGPPAAPGEEEPDAAPAVKAEPAAATGSGAAAPPAPKPSPGTQVVRVRNAAAVPLVAFHADPIGAPRGPDRLGRAALPSGESMNFAPPDDLPPGPARCLADLTAVFGDGRELRLPARDICAGGEVVVE